MKRSLIILLSALSIAALAAFGLSYAFASSTDDAEKGRNCAVEHCSDDGDGAYKAAYGKRDCPYPESSAHSSASSSCSNWIKEHCREMSKCDRMTREECRTRCRESKHAKEAEEVETAPSLQ